MKKIPFTLVAVLVLCAGLLAACTANKADSPDMVGAAWRLVSYGSTASPTPALPDVEATLTFGEDKQLSGSMGCNQFSGAYSLNGHEIRLDSVSSTMMACDEPRMLQESTVFGLMTGRLNFAVEGDVLILTSADGASTLTFQKLGR